MQGSNASVPISASDQPGKAGSYGYVPFKKPAGARPVARAQQIEQDIDPVGVANNVLSKLEALE